MTRQNISNVNLSNSQLNKSKLAIKNGTVIILILIIAIAVIIKHYNLIMKLMFHINYC